MKPAHRIMAVADVNADTSAIRRMKGISSLIIRKRSYALEIDFHTDKPEDAFEQLRNITEVSEFRHLNEENISYSKEYFQSVLNREDEIISQARKLFSEERYWEAHTVLEDLWKASAGTRKKALQGIIIIAASLTHYQMGEFDVSHRMYSKGIDLIRQGTSKSPQEYGYSVDFSYPCNFPEIL